MRLWQREVIVDLKVQRGGGAEESSEQTSVWK